MKRFVCLILIFSCLFSISIPQIAFADVTVFSEETPVVRKPVTLTKSGSAPCSFYNDYCQGTFFADYSIKYTVSGGGYTVNSCSVTYDYFTGYVRGDLYQPYVTYSTATNGTLSITFFFQVKYELNGLTYYTPRYNKTVTISLAN